MSNFFESIQTLYENETFCDVEISIYKAGDETLLQSVNCHAIVLCSAIPSITEIMKQIPSETLKSSLIVVLAEDESISSASDTINSIYNCLKGHEEPQSQLWVHSLLGKWPLKEDSTVRHQGVRAKKRRGAKTLKHLEDIELNFETNNSNCEFSRFNGTVATEEKFLTNTDENFTNFENCCKKEDLLDETETSADQRCSSTSRKKKPQNKRTLKRGQCPECLEIFPSSNSTERRKFVVHKLSHHSCNCPGITFTSVTAFRAHMTSVHSDKKNISFRCTHGKCHAIFFSKNALEHHVRVRHTSIVENGVGRICDECGQAFVNRHHLNIHTRHRHAQIKCPQCDVICIGKLNFNKHREKLHTLPELCDYCGKSFPSKKFLRIHVMNLHLTDSERPNRCDLCGKGFLSKILLRDHIDVVHHHKKPYSCRSEACDRSFTTSACRRRHELKVHQLNISLKRGATSKYVVSEAQRLLDTEELNLA